jgi:hypothetical protein
MSEISLACWRDMMEAILSYVPVAQRDTARSEALAIGIGHAVEADRPGKRRQTRRRSQ